MSGHAYVLVQLHPAALGGAETVVKCTHCFTVWAGNLTRLSNPLAYYSPDEADEMRRVSAEDQRQEDR